MVAAKKNQKDSKGREGLARRASGLLSKPVTAVTTGALERALLAEFPAADAEPWDRTGMSVGDPARLWYHGRVRPSRAGAFGSFVTFAPETADRATPVSPVPLYWGFSAAARPRIGGAASIRMTAT